VLQTNPEGIATIDGDRRRSWREIGERVARLAGGLREFGVNRFRIVANMVRHAQEGRQLFEKLSRVANRFLEKFKAATDRLRMGNPLDEATTLAPLSSREALDRLMEQVERSVAKGARILLGGRRLEGKGAFMQPTILTDIKPGNPAYTEELFGPVALFFRVPDEDAAIALANDTPFGLGASVFTQDIPRGKRVARRIESGMVFINRATWSAPELPFGGIKRSGYGRELSHLGIHEFVNKKLIRVTTVDAPY